MLIEKLQTQLENLYGIDIPQRVGDYLIGREEALRILSTNENVNLPKELFLVHNSDNNTVKLALFLDKKLMRSLAENDPFVSLNDNNISDLCILIEGVSHFLYFLWKAHQHIPITRLELELQAEIDKFLIFFCYLQSINNLSFCRDLFEILFEHFNIMDHITDEGKQRYLTASTLASRYCYRLHQRFRDPAKLQALTCEIRRFYNLSQEQKIRCIVN